MPAAQSSTLPDRRPIAVGIIGRTAGRTVTIIRTADGITGAISSRCPVCKGTVETCSCTGTTALPVPKQQTFDDDESDACPICGYWTCRCGTQHTGRALAVAR
ncbi:MULTISPECIES: hypothetical protein [unclassified Streptomyces]|uniref:hypothetical protein n=1 Tax=unclassified Streptomyces TaxID=2593676 RepID=UPI002E0FBA70|nr:hypothetical protein OG725_24425 [Streptomyces sp. NBC_01213]WSQ82774.1 hypothetical protein OG725_37370 [Streptomyces sp. NBC_01213]WSR50907.1 hypothetical protein OG279_26175 [Streptomyces sp. NBC_01201]